jgi:hypothetical protein
MSPWFTRIPTCVTGTWRNGLWMIWTGRVTVDGLRAVDRVGRRLVKVHPKYFTVSISIGGVPLPDSDARAYAANLVKQRESNVLISATVLAGDGFWISASRMVTEAIFALTSQRRLNKVCATFRDAADVVAPHVTPSASVAEVVTALDTMKALSEIKEPDATG